MTRYTIFPAETPMFNQFQIEHYAQRLAEVRKQPDSDDKVKAIAFLRSTLWNLKKAYQAQYN